MENEVKEQRYVIPSDKDGYVDTFQDNEVTDGSFITEQHRWEDAKLGYAVMKFGAKDVKEVGTSIVPFFLTFEKFNVPYELFSKYKDITLTVTLKFEYLYL